MIIFCLNVRTRRILKTKLKLNISWFLAQMLNQTLLDVSTISSALIIQARINGRKYPCLIETGSEVTIINESLVPSVELKESTHTLRAANGSSIRVSGVVELPLFIGRHQFQSSFIVSPQIRNVILGLDWLEAHGCLIDCRNLTLIVGNNRFKLRHVDIERKGPMNCRILKTAVKTPGPQSQAGHVDEVKLIHIESGLEESIALDGLKFQPGQLVYYLYPRKFQGKSFKFQKVYTGPWKIVEQTGPVNYKIWKTSAKIPGP